MAHVGGEEDQLRAIIQAFLAGDGHFFQTLKARITRYVVYHHTANADDRADVVSDILRTLLVNLRARRFHGKTIGELNSYIFSIARLKVMRASQQARATAARAPDCQIEEIADGSCEPQDLQLSEKDFVSKVLATMDPRNRMLMTLKFQDGWSDQEIADHMSMTKNAVSTAISRAIKKAQELKIVKELLYQKPGERHLGERGKGHELSR